MGSPQTKLPILKCDAQHHSAVEQMNHAWQLKNRKCKATLRCMFFLVHQQFFSQLINCYHRVTSWSISIGRNSLKFRKLESSCSKLLLVTSPKHWVGESLEKRDPDLDCLNSTSIILLSVFYLLVLGCHICLAWIKHCCKYLPKSELYDRKMKELRLTSKKMKTWG